MDHPSNFLSPGQNLTPDTWRQLNENSSSQTSDPDTQEITFRFSAQAVNDSYDMVVTANVQDNTFRCEPRPHRACQRDPLECQCVETRCSVCENPLVAVITVCSSLFCVTDSCPLCRHQGEECMYEMVRTAVAEEASVVGAANGLWGLATSG